MIPDSLSPPRSTLGRATGLTPELLARVFPFHLAFDRNDTVVQVGDGIRKALPALAVGHRLEEYFRARQPRIPLTYAAVRGHSDALFLLESRTTPLVLKGQMLVVNGVILFLGSPWVTSMGELAGLGLSLEDFALHDPVADYLVVLETRTAALEDVRRLSAKLGATQERLRRMVTSMEDAAHIGGWEWDMGADRFTWTDELYRLHGLAPQSLPITFERLLACCHPDDRDRVRAAVEKAREDGRPFEITYRIVRPDGRARTLHVRGATIAEDGGRPGRMLGTGQDITELTQLEERLALSQKLEAVGRLAGGVAHDFNNLLTAILSYAELALDGLPATDPRRGDIGEIKRAAERASALTRQLLAFSRRQILRPKVLDLNTLVANLDQMLRRLIGEDIEVVTQLQPRLGRVEADPGQLEQVIVNLAVNARDAMPCGGRLLIETADVDLDETSLHDNGRMEPGRYVMLAVSDTGTGMDEETKAHVFEPFFTTKPEGKGTGLGLATAYGIVKQSGGYIWVYSELGHGTTFKIYLPRVPTAADVVTAPAGPGPDLRGRETLLLVEDEEAVRRVARTALEQYGYTVLEAANGGEALRQVERWSGPVHLVVTDVIMPEMGGRDLIQRLTATRPGTRVLFVSGYTDDAIVRHGVLRAGVPFLEKPFTPRALLGAVRRVLDGAA
ncbi:MAG TPA: ATP-binding protein [Gemmatimonadales bacterium]|nr:ATP-binding protein [Gemmatimonadales bacterium]